MAAVSYCMSLGTIQQVTGHRGLFQPHIWLILTCISWTDLSIDPVNQLLVRYPGSKSLPDPTTQ